MLDDFTQPGEVFSSLAGVSKESCPNRGFQKKWVQSDRNGALEDAFTLIMKNAGIKGSYMTPMWMYVK